MKRACLFFALFAACAIAEDPPRPEPLLDARTREKLEEALRCVNLTTADLGWNKRPIDDDFRLKCVNDTLDRPLELADCAERAEREFGDDPASAAESAAAWLDLPKPAPVMRDEKRPRMDNMTQDADAILGELWHAKLVSERALERALAPLSDEERTLIRDDGSKFYLSEDEDGGDPAPVLAAAKKTDVSAFAQAAFELASAAKTVRELGAKSAGAKWQTTHWDGAGPRIAMGGPGPDRHENCEIVLDSGGDDVYVNCRFVADLGGHDTYRDCAAGLLGGALLVDLAGDDVYRNGNIGQGGALFGASLLFEVGGDDRYEADQLSQGSGVFGVGMLFDLAGNDGYRGARFVQGFGGVRGLGVLSDMKGNDTYYAGGKYSHAPLLPENFQSLSQGFGFGMRPVASGGVGILADHAGNDVYAAEVFGQGASYWYALGVLADSAGHDKYVLYQYGQGSGIHLSSGVLFDRAGNDSYACNNGVAQGCGHDWAAGLLLDLAGDDYYTGAGMTQGGANANGLGILIDRRGNDGYSGSRPEVQGFSFQSRGSFGLGVLLDLDGKDKYSENGRDNLTWTKTTLGVGLDSEEKK